MRSLAWVSFRRIRSMPPSPLPCIIQIQDHDIRMMPPAEPIAEVNSRVSSTVPTPALRLGIGIARPQTAKYSCRKSSGESQDKRLR
jgi:hypothetical protein